MDFTTTTNLSTLFCPRFFPEPPDALRLPAARPGSGWRTPPPFPAQSRDVRAACPLASIRMIT